MYVCCVYVCIHAWGECLCGENHSHPQQRLLLIEREGGVLLYTTRCALSEYFCGLIFVLRNDADLMASIHNRTSIHR